MREGDFVKDAIAELHSKLAPSSRAKREATEGLCVEEFVGENHTLADERNRFANTNRSGRAEGVVRIFKDAPVRFGAELDESVVSQFFSAQQRLAGRVHQFTEERSGRAGGEKICAMPVADTFFFAPIVADFRMVQCERHEPVESHLTARVSLCAENCQKRR